MKYRKIPGTQLNPSVICLGALPFGVSLDEPLSFALLDRFVEAGGNFIDTAIVYGEWLPNGKGLNEKTVGRWLKSRRNREKVIIGTKGAHPRLDSMNVPRLSPAEIASDLDESLQNLQTGYIDLYWLHRDDPARPVAEILTTLNEQVQAGKIRHFGCSNWKLDRLREAQAYAAAHGLQGFAGNQLKWSLAAPNLDAVADPTLVVMDRDTWEYHKESQLAAMAYNSQGRGYFAKLDASLKANTAVSPDLRKNYENAENLQKFERVKRLAAATGHSISAVSLAYLMAQPFPAYPIAGCTTMQQLEENLAAAEVNLDAAQAAYLDNGA